jgi:hypothetical protein
VLAPFRPGCEAGSPGGFGAGMGTGFCASRSSYAARLEDLRPGDLVQLECTCGRSELLTPAMLTTVGVKGSDKLLDLAPRLRCRERDVRGKAVVSVKWGQ